MKILILSNSDSGLFQFRGELIKTLTETYEVVCCTPNEDGYIDKIEQLGCRCVIISFNRRGVNPLQELKILSFYKHLLNIEKPSIVLTYTIKPNVYGGMACVRSKIPYIANVTGLGDSIANGGVLQKISVLLYKYGLRKSSCVFFQNKYNQQFFEDHRIAHGKTVTIPGSGVNLVSHCYEEYPKEESEVRLLFVARIKKDKGIEELLKAIHNIRRDYGNCVVEILGGCEGDYLDRIKEAEELGDIRYYGQQRDVHSYYKECHCVVLPSYHEGTSNVLLEGSSTGRPIIATNIPGCQEIFDEEISGFGCNPRDADSLEIAIRKFLVLTNEQKAEMGIEARKKVEREFDRNIVISSYLREIEKTLVSMKE